MQMNKHNKNSTKIKRGLNETQVSFIIKTVSNMKSTTALKYISKI
jgi:hypothetical protein